MKITREELQAIENHISNIPPIAGMYAPVLVAWCRALLDEQDDAASDDVTRLRRLLKMAEDEAVDAGDHARREATRADTAEAEAETLRAERDEARVLCAEWAEKAATWIASPEAAQRERDEARAQLAATDTDSPCDGHRHCCADRRKLAEEP